MTDETIIITTRRLPNRFAIALEVAPLVRTGVITDAEGHALVERRYKERAYELRQCEIEEEA